MERRAVASLLRGRSASRCISDSLHHGRLSGAKPNGTGSVHPVQDSANREIAEHRDQPDHFAVCFSFHGRFSRLSAKHPWASHD